MAEWKPFDLTWGRSIYACSACEEAIEVPTCNGEPLYNFCPMCGANMNMKKADGCKTENSSEKPNNSTCSKMEQVDKDIYVRSKDEPQTNKEIVLDPSFAELSDEQFVKAMKLIEPQTDCGWK